MIKAQTHNLSGGESGTKETLQKMRDLIRKEKINPKNIELVRFLTKDLPEKDKEQEADTLGDYVRKTMRYINDLYGVETLQDLEVSLFRLKSGDCDDHTIAGSTLFEIAGIPTRLVAVKMPNAGGYSHVYFDALINGRWKHYDLIEKEKPLGWECGREEVKMILPITMSSEEMQNYPVGEYISEEAILNEKLKNGSITIAEYNVRKNQLVNPFKSSKQAEAEQQKDLTFALISVLLVGGILLNKKGRK